MKKQNNKNIKNVNYEPHRWAEYNGETITYCNSVCHYTRVYTVYYTVTGDTVRYIQSVYTERMLIIGN